MDQIYISYVLIGLAVIVSLKGFNDAQFMDQYLYKPYNVKHYKEYYRIITHVFLHGDPMHLLFNMITLYFFGPFIEQVFRYDFGFVAGSILFLVLFVLSSVFSTLIQYIRHKDHEYYRSLGASGAISAILFAAIMVFPTMELRIFFAIPIPAFVFGPLYLLFEFWSDRNRKTNIAHEAHIAGALFGILFILITNIDRVIDAFNSFF